MSRTRRGPVGGQPPGPHQPGQMMNGHQMAIPPHFLQQVVPERDTTINQATSPFQVNYHAFQQHVADFQHYLFTTLSYISTLPADVTSHPLPQQQQQQQHQHQQQDPNNKKPQPIQPAGLPREQHEHELTNHLNSLENGYNQVLIHAQSLIETLDHLEQRSLIEDAVINPHYPTATPHYDTTSMSSSLPGTFIATNYALTPPPNALFDIDYRALNHDDIELEATLDSLVSINMLLNTKPLIFPKPAGALGEGGLVQDGQQQQQQQYDTIQLIPSETIPMTAINDTFSNIPTRSYTSLLPPGVISKPQHHQMILQLGKMFGLANANLAVPYITPQQGQNIPLAFPQLSATQNVLLNAALVSEKIRHMAKQCYCLDTLLNAYLIECGVVNPQQQQQDNVSK